MRSPDECRRSARDEQHSRRAQGAPIRFSVRGEASQPRWKAARMLRIIIMAGEP
jgi:hypothetical protein